MNARISAPHLATATACIKALDTQQTVPVYIPSSETSPVLRDLGNGLHVVYLMETEHGLVYVQNHELQRHGLTEDQLFEIGVNNLRNRSDDKARLKQFGPIYGMLLDNMFEASLILRDDLWDDTLAHLAPNGFVAALPARDTLAVCDAASKDGISTLKAMTSRAFAAGKSHLLTPSLYLRQQGKWVRMG